MRNLSSALITFTPFLSDVRLIPYRLTFDISNDHELMGAYLWSQHTASALYPLFHFVEIFVRNSIDKEAKKGLVSFGGIKLITMIQNIQAENLFQILRMLKKIFVKHGSRLRKRNLDQNLIKH